ncbi:hypothetical protein [Candidatus Hodarchaeum mangrovi]
MFPLNTDGIKLDRYQCAQCSRVPEKAEEILKGCKCGHRLFRIKIQPKNQTSSEFIQSNPIPSEEMDFLTIHEKGIGVYEINVSHLLDEKTKGKSSPLIAGNKGVFTIRLNP